jgi:ABC-2 type transport system permease protein
VTRRTSQFVQVWLVARRSIRRTMRQPATIFPALAFPLMLLAINAGGLAKTTHLPGFPTDSYLTFALAVPFMQGALFSMMGAGTDLARDVQTGFLNRLALTPLTGTALIAGELAGIVVFGAFQGVVYLIVGLLAGAHLEAGVLGALVLISLSIVMALGFGALGAAAALRFGSAEAVQGLFPLFFVCLFLSSMSLPRPLIEHDWFRTVATWNPVSYLLEAVRSVLITGWDATALARGFGVAGGIIVLGVVLSNVTLRQRMVRT